MATFPTAFGGQNFLITPVALAVNETKPGSISDQKWLLLLTGVAIFNLQGNKVNDWRRETLTIMPDVITALKFAMSKHAFPTPPAGTHPEFNVEQLAPFAGVSSSFVKSSSGVDAGFAVDSWRPSPFQTGTDVGGKPVRQRFAGVDIDVAVRNNKATLHRVNYHFTLLGKIVVLFNEL